MNARRMVILTQGFARINTCKTAVNLLHYCPGEVTALLDATARGGTASDVFGLPGPGGRTPFIGSLDEAPKASNMLTLGLALVGGAIPKPWFPVIRAALKRGWDLMTGTHVFLSRDPELAALAKKHGCRIIDTRMPPADLACNTLIARRARVKRVLTVGTDCDVGKMVASVEITRALRGRGIDAGFAATGQTGIMIAGSGIAVDAVPADFVAGAAERLVMDHHRRQVVILEGQGTIHHPLYSGVSLGLLHGSAPQALILVHAPWRKKMKHLDVPVVSVRQSIQWHLEAAAMVNPTRVIGIAINGKGMEKRDLLAEIRKVERRTKLPATDVYAFGPEPLADAVINFFKLETGN